MKLSWLNDIYEVYKDPNVTRISCKNVNDIDKQYMTDVKLLYEFFNTHEHTIDDINDYIIYKTSQRSIYSVPIMYLLVLVNDIKLLKYVLTNYPAININNKLISKLDYNDNIIDHPNVIVTSLQTCDDEFTIYLLNTFKDKLTKTIITAFIEYILKNNMDKHRLVTYLELLIDCDNLDVMDTIVYQSLLIHVLLHYEIPDELKMKFYIHNTVRVNKIKLHKQWGSSLPEKYVMKLLQDGCNRQPMIKQYILCNPTLLIRCIRQTGWRDIFECIMTERRYELLDIYRREIRRMIWLYWCISNGLCRDIELLVYNNLII
jgi:hypothetical protein